jgi:hypothetical protein
MLESREFYLKYFGYVALALRLCRIALEILKESLIFSMELNVVNARTRCLGVLLTSGLNGRNRGKISDRFFD